MATTLRDSMAEDARGFFGVGVVMSDGSVQEFGKADRRWPSVEAFHADRAGRAANLILYFPAENDAQTACVPASDSV